MAEDAVKEEKEEAGGILGALSHFKEKLEEEYFTPDESETSDELSDAVAAPPSTPFTSVKPSVVNVNASVNEVKGKFVPAKYKVLTEEIFSRCPTVKQFFEAAKSPLAKAITDTKSRNQAILAQIGCTPAQLSADLTKALQALNGEIVGYRQDKQGSIAGETLPKEKELGAINGNIAGFRMSIQEISTKLEQDIQDLRSQAANATGQLELQIKQEEGRITPLQLEISKIQAEHSGELADFEATADQFTSELTSAQAEISNIN